MQPPFKMILETDIEKWRYETLFSKEPETIAWIDDMQPGEVLYDVGANIGIYTLYAASMGLIVIAVEPVLENFARLVQNLDLNGFKNVIPFYGGCGAESGYGSINIPNHAIGASGAQLSNTGRVIPIFALDDFAEEEKEYHIKVDVDGVELKIIAGAYQILSEKKPKSMLIEFNQWSNSAIVGYTRDNKYNTMTPHSRERRQREGIDAENVVFTRI